LLKIIDNSLQDFPSENTLIVDICIQIYSHFIEAIKTNKFPAQEPWVKFNLFFFLF